jgi:polysaccharide biosynthesis transport protein
MYLTRNSKVALGSVAVALLAFVIWQAKTPDIYEASTLILVDPQKLPESFVHSTVSMNLSSRISTINQQLMSSTRLQRIIDTYDLYKPLKGHKTQEEIVEQMRHDIRVEVAPGLDGMPDGSVRAFRIYYRGPQPPMVAQVTNQLASLFIEENLKVREQQAEGTCEFIDARLDIAKKQLERAEAVMGKGSKEDRMMADLNLSVLRDDYVSLLKKKLEADAAADLEKRQKSERFTILDPARIPEKPINRHGFLTAGF